MSMKRLAILAAVGQGTLNGTSVTLLGANMTTTSGGSRASAGSLHGNVNVLLGGAMLSGVILVVFLVCYCCHRNMRKHAPPYPGYWREPEVPMEVFTLAGQGQCYETSGLFIPEGTLEPVIRPPTPGPPPAYDAVIAAEKEKLSSELTTSPDNEKSESTKVDVSDESGLPSYEAALRIEAGGYFNRSFELKIIDKNKYELVTPELYIKGTPLTTSPGSERTSHKGRRIWGGGHYSKPQS